MFNIEFNRNLISFLTFICVALIPVLLIILIVINIHIIIQSELLQS